MSSLMLVRHGQSTYNLKNLFTGNTDVPLTQLGRQEARQAGIKLKGYRFNAAYTSMLKRAQETCRIILEEINQNQIPVIKDKALNERMYGSLQGLNKTATILKYGATQVDLWRRSYDACPPNGESLKATFERCVPFYKLNIEPRLAKGENILVVAHGNSLRALFMYLENTGQALIATVNIPTGIPRLYNFDLQLRLIDAAYL